MTAVPDTHDFTSGSATTSELNAYIRDPIRFLLNPPRCEVRQTVSQNLSNGVGAPITFNSEDLDENVAGLPQHDTSTNPSRFTCVYPGWYEVGGAAGFAANATGQRIVIWYVNGSPLTSGQATDQALSALGNKVAARGKHVYLNVGDYVELYAFQNSGGTLATNVAAGEQSSMMVRWVSN